MTKEENASERGANRSRQPRNQAFREFIGSNWGPRPQGPERSASADFLPARHAKLGERFRGVRLVVPAGGYKVRNNDCDYRFRAHSAFAHMTGLGGELEPDSVLVLNPVGDEHEATLYFHPRASRSSEEFYADARYGEFWVGARPSLEEMSTLTGLKCAAIDTLGDALAKDLGQVQMAVVSGVDAGVEAQVIDLRESAGIAESCAKLDTELAEALAELRLVKDDFEIEEMRKAVAATHEGFEAILASLGRAKAHRRGERVVEGAFHAKAREEGNGLGYDTIAASGNHANTLHWIDNDGAERDGELILVDAGVEMDSLYTADITRTLPVNGVFSPAQAEVYQAVLDAADAAFARAQEPGCKFSDVHDAAMEVIAARLEGWGMLPGTAAESLAEDGGFHRRWMPHGTSHHLGLDVHDCAQARREMYVEAELAPGMVFTIEPGLYFREDDLLVPERFRGIGVRIEDDVVVTGSGAVRISEGIPRTVPEIEAWMASVAR